MENYKRCLICGNYFETEENDHSEEPVCSSCEIKKYHRCSVCGEYVCEPSDEQMICLKCQAEYVDCGFDINLYSDIGLHKL